MSPTFKILIRLIGVAGLCIGGCFVFLGLLTLISKGQQFDLEFWGVGTGLIVLSIYFILGAPHFLIPRIHRRAPKA